MNKVNNEFYPRTKRIDDASRYSVDSNGCWNYLMGLHKNGYGQYSIHLGKHRYKNILAHRYFYEKHKGNVKNGNILDHLCRNRSCVNPDHLEEVTHKVNTQRGLLAKLDDTAIRNIRLEYSLGAKQKTLSNIFGVCQSDISRIVNYKTWNNIYAN